MLPSQVPGYAVGPLIGLSVNGALALFSLLALLIYRQYRPLMSLCFFYFALSSYFLGFTIYGYQSSPGAIISGYRVMLLSLCWLPITWIWLVDSFRERPHGAWAWTAVGIAALFSLSLLIFKQPIGLGPELVKQPVAGVMHPAPCVIKPLIYLLDLAVIVTYIFNMCWRWWPGPRRPAYVKVVVIGLVFWLAGGLHDASHALHGPVISSQPVLWLASVWLSLCLAAAVALHLKGVERELARYRHSLEDIVAERTQELEHEVLERRKAEDALQHLAAGVAHNFNNVLMTVQGNAEAAKALLPQEKERQGEVRQLLENVVQGAMTGKDVSRRLANAVKRAKKPDDQGEPLEVAAMLRSLRKTCLGTWPDFARGAMNLFLEAQEGVYVKGVAGELMEVFVNLAKNAVEALQASAGEKSLKISCVADEKWVLIDFADSGPGVSPQELEGFFTPFFSTKGATGQGLGLAVSKSIIQAHGGEITAHSQPGRGTRLGIRLPRVQAFAKDNAGAPRPDFLWAWDVLILDDEALAAMGVKVLLEKEGHRVRVVSRMADALEEAHKRPPQLIISDLGIHNHQGWQAYVKLVKGTAWLGEDMPALVVLTGWSLEQLPDLPAGVRPPDAILQKPLSYQALEAAVIGVLAGRPA